MTETLADLIDVERRMLDALVRDRQRGDRGQGILLRGELRHDAEVAARRRLRAELDAELAAPLIGRGVLTQAELAEARVAALASVLRNGKTARHRRGK